MFAVHLDKLRFLTEEMQLGHHLVAHAPDSFCARTLARHILIRAENFIEHARSIRRPLNIAGYDTRGFHETKEAYASNFAEYFKAQRDRLGAHVQDFDFDKRIERWNDIELSKIRFFVDGAQELYRLLGSMNISGYSDYGSLPDLNDAIVAAALNQLRRSGSDQQGMEFAADPLAMTRENTTAMFNSSPIHARAGQLALIRRWITMQSSLLEKMPPQSAIARILKARIVTDIVNFCDCLVTRAVAPSAPQEMDGLDKLITAENRSPASIVDLVAVSNFDWELQQARTIRDRIGAHLHLDASAPLSSLLAALDVYDLARGKAFYELAVNAFIKVCRSIVFLRMYVADGQKIYGVLSGGYPSIPFSADFAAPKSARLAPHSPNDEAAYWQNLTRWLDGNDVQRKRRAQLFLERIS